MDPVDLAVLSVEKRDNEQHILCAIQQQIHASKDRAIMNEELFIAQSFYTFYTTHLLGLVVVRESEGLAVLPAQHAPAVSGVGYEQLVAHVQRHHRRAPRHDPER